MGIVYNDTEIDELRYKVADNDRRPISYSSIYVENLNTGIGLLVPPDTTDYWLSGPGPNQDDIWGYGCYISYDMSGNIYIYRYGNKGFTIRLYSQAKDRHVDVMLPRDENIGSNNGKTISSQGITYHNNGEYVKIKNLIYAKDLTNYTLSLIESLNYERRKFYNSLICQLNWVVSPDATRVAVSDKILLYPDIDGVLYYDNDPLYLRYYGASWHPTDWGSLLYKFDSDKETEKSDRSLYIDIYTDIASYSSGNPKISIPVYQSSDFTDAGMAIDSYSKKILVPFDGNEVTENVDIVESKEILKNLIKVPYYNGGTNQFVNNGITYTIVDDTIVANGVATADSYFILAQNVNSSYLYESGYLLSNTEGTNNQDSYVAINKKRSGVVVGELANTTDIEHQEFTIDWNADYDSLDIVIKIASGTSVDNCTFYPMVRYWYIQDDSYSRPNQLYSYSFPESHGTFSAYIENGYLKVKNHSGANLVADLVAYDQQNDEIYMIDRYIADNTEILTNDDDFYVVNGEGLFVCFFDDDDYSEKDSNYYYTGDKDAPKYLDERFTSWTVSYLLDQNGTKRKVNIFKNIKPETGKSTYSNLIYLTQSMANQKNVPIVRDKDNCYIYDIVGSQNVPFNKFKGTIAYIEETFQGIVFKEQSFELVKNGQAVTFSATLTPWNTTYRVSLRYYISNNVPKVELSITNGNTCSFAGFYWKIKNLVGSSIVDGAEKIGKVKADVWYNNSVFANDPDNNKNISYYLRSDEVVTTSIYFSDSAYYGYYDHSYDWVSRN